MKKKFIRGSEVKLCYNNNMTNMDSRLGMTTVMSIMITIIMLELVGIFYFADKRGFFREVVPVNISVVSESQILDYLKKNMLTVSAGAQVFCAYQTLGESELTAEPVHIYVWALCSEFSFTGGKITVDLNFRNGKTVSSPVDLVARRRDGGIEIASHKMPG